MSSISIPPSTGAAQLAQAKTQSQVTNKPQQAQQLHTPQQMAQDKIANASVAPKPALPKSPQAGGNGVPPKPVSTSTKTVQHLHRINVQA